MPLFFSPEIAYAAVGKIQLVENFKSVILNPLIMLLFGAALVYFLWGLYQVVAGGAEPGQREIGRQHILWGVVGMFIMVAVYGLLNIISATVSTIFT